MTKLMIKKSLQRSASIVLFLSTDVSHQRVILL